MGRLLRRRGASQIDGTGFSAVTFDSTGVAESDDVADILREAHDVQEIGAPALYTYAETSDGSTAEILTVPSGKVWRLLGLVHQQTNSSDVATRTVVVDVRDSGDSTIEALSSATSVADAETEYSFLWGSDGNVAGNSGVAAQGTLTVAVNPTADDTMVINGTTFTFVAALTGAVNEILIGANVAATQASIENAIGATPDGTAADHSVTDTVRTAIGVTGADFATNDMVLTAVNQGTAGNSIATTETFTSGSNVFDAATLGTTTAGVDEADTISALDFPTAGPLLSAGEDVEISVTNGQTADDFKGYLFVIEYDADPSAEAL